MSKVHPFGIKKKLFAAGTEQAALLQGAHSESSPPFMSPHELGPLLSLVGLSALEDEEAKASKLLNALQTLIDAVAALTDFFTPTGESLAERKLEGPVDHSRECTVAKDAVRGASQSSIGSKSSRSSRSSDACEESHASTPSTSTHIPGALLLERVEEFATGFSRRRRRRHVFSENGIEISWLSPRCWESSLIVGECEEALQRGSAIKREQRQQQATCPAATAATPAAAAVTAAFPAGAAAAANANAVLACVEETAPSAAAAFDNLEALAALHGALENARAALAAREKETGPNGFQLLKDIFCCLRDVFDAFHKEQQRRRKRQQQRQQQQQQQQQQHKEKQLPSEAFKPGGLSPFSPKQRAALAESHSTDISAYIRMLDSPSAAARPAPLPAAAGSAAAPSSGGAESRNAGDPLPVPPNPWHVGGLGVRTDAAAAAAASTAAAAAAAPMSADREAMMWRDHVAYRANTESTSHKPAFPQQQQQQQQRQRASTTCVWPELQPETCLVLPPVAPVTAADIERVLRQARLKAGLASGAC
ncbi:hypothetical protein Emag_007485 [Eimeria magna]